VPSANNHDFLLFAVRIQRVVPLAFYTQPVDPALATKNACIIHTP